MKRFILIATLLCMVVGIQAQDRFSPDEFEQKFQKYITEKVGFTADEAQKFFPLYREFKDKQRVNFRKVHELQRKTDIEKTTEEDFRKLNDELLELEIANTRIEKEYLQKFRQIISDKKYFLVGWAENAFQREMLHQARNHRKPGAPPAGRPRK